MKYLIILIFQLKGWFGLSVVLCRTQSIREKKKTKQERSERGVGSGKSIISSSLCTVSSFFFAILIYVDSTREMEEEKWQSSQVRCVWHFDECHDMNCQLKLTYYSLISRAGKHDEQKWKTHTIFLFFPTRHTRRRDEISLRFTNFSLFDSMFHWVAIQTRRTLDICYTSSPQLSAEREAINEIGNFHTFKSTHEERKVKLFSAWKCERKSVRETWKMPKDWKFSCFSLLSHSLCSLSSPSNKLDSSHWLQTWWKWGGLSARAEKCERKREKLESEKLSPMLRKM